MNIKHTAQFSERPVCEMNQMFQLWWFGLVMLAALPLCDTCWKTIYVPLNRESCGPCGDKIQVSFTLRNKFQEPYFEHSHTVSDMPQRELIHFMEAAAENKSEFSFTVEYQKKLGFFINRMNGLTASNLKRTFWKVMSTSTGVMLPLGVSQYIPKNNESITFDFTTWASTTKSRDNTGRKPEGITDLSTQSNEKHVKE